jgi:3-oxoacyl-[acyl-carrier protein] reductase
MSEEEFDSVIRVHLKGHFCSMRMATEYWRNKAKAGESVYGRLISTSSEAFLFGSVGQPNYAAAKAGITAMTMAAAQAMIKYGVTANVVCPRARTRMNDSGPHAALFAKPESGFDKYAPENLGPFVAYLASPQAQRISGEVFVVWGKQVTVVGRPTLDTKFKNAADAPWTVDSLHEQLGPHFEQRVPVQDGFSVPPQ